MAHDTDIPEFLLDAPDTSAMLDAPTGRWLVIRAQRGQTWLISQASWRCIRFNITEEEINGIQKT